MHEYWLLIEFFNVLQDVLQNKRDQLLRQLEDAKELKKNIDKRGYSLSSLLQKYLSESELEDYQRFIQTKCRLLIHSRSINDKIFDLQRLVNALKEDEIESNNNSPLQFINWLYPTTNQYSSFSYIPSFIRFKYIPI